MSKTAQYVEWKLHRILAFFLPTVLPPPIPLLPFALAAGALGVSRQHFLAVYDATRTFRYSLIAWLGVACGRRIVSTWSGAIQKWSSPLLCVFVGLLVAGVCYGIWNVRSLGKTDAAEKLARDGIAASPNRTTELLYPEAPV